MTFDDAIFEVLKEMKVKMKEKMKAKKMSWEKFMITLAGM